MVNPPHANSETCDSSQNELTDDDEFYSESDFDEILLEEEKRDRLSKGQEQTVKIVTLSLD